jgi:SAM-dependent methyltransferase
MTDSGSQVRVAPIGSVDAIVGSLAPEAYYQSPGGRTFLIAASMLGGIARGASVLDVSCGIGQAAVDLAEAFGCKVTAFDNFPPYLAFGRQLAVNRSVSKLVSFMELDGEGIRDQFEAASFDVVLGMGGGLGDVFSNGISAGLRAAHRWLKPGGLLICGDLISPARVSPLMEIVFEQSLSNRGRFRADLRQPGNLGRLGRHARHHRGPAAAQPGGRHRRRAAPIALDRSRAGSSRNRLPERARPEISGK